MRGVNILICCLFLALTLVAAGAPLFASDLNSRGEPYPEAEGPPPAGELTPRRVAEFCNMQRVICRKVCNLRSRFDDKFDGCPQSCESRAGRCILTACYRWTDPDFLIAERFGGAQCAL